MEILSKYGRHVPGLPEARRLHIVLDKAIQSAIKGTKHPREALEHAALDHDNALARARQE